MSKLPSIFLYDLYYISKIYYGCKSAVPKMFILRLLTCLQSTNCIEKPKTRVVVAAKDQLDTVRGCTAQKK